MEKRKHCGLLIKQINTTLEKKANNDLREFELTVSQLTVIRLLNSAYDGKMILKDIEKNLHLAQSTVAGIVSRLVEKNFVEYFDTLDDKRVKGIKITNKGIEMCEIAEIKVVELEEKLLSSLTDTEKIVIITLLEKISNNIE